MTLRIKILTALQYISLCIFTLRLTKHSSFLPRYCQYSEGILIFKTVHHNFFEKLKFGKVIFTQVFFGESRTVFACKIQNKRCLNQMERETCSQYDLNQFNSCIHLHVPTLFSLKLTRICHSTLLFLNESSQSAGNYVRTIQIGF